MSRHELPASMNKFKLTLITAKKPPILSKSFYRADDGTLIKHPGGNLVSGTAQTLTVSVADFMRGLAALKPNQAFVYGICDRATARIVPKAKLEAARKTAPKEAVIARDRENFAYPDGRGVCMIDHDPAPGMPPLSREDLLPALYGACPGLKSHPHVWTASASSCIYTSEGKELRGIVGQRIYIFVQDARDIPRFGNILYQRLWLAGFGRFDVSKSGSLLNRNIIDAAVWQPERLDFAGGAYCGPGLVQRRPEPMGFNIDAPFLDSRTLPDLTPDELKELEQSKAAARQKMKPAMEERRETWIAERVAEHKTDPAKWREVFQAAVRDKRLLGDFVLYPHKSGPVSVGTVLDNPDKWHGARFADPLEPDYGNDNRIAWVNLRAAGRPYIWSHAHGGQRYTMHRAVSTIQIQGGERPQIVKRLLELARLDGALFDRGGELVRIAGGQMFPVDGPWLELYLTGLSRFEKFDARSESWQPKDCPKDVAQAILSCRGEWGLPLLDAIQQIPTIDPSTGRVLDTDGYDAERRLYLDLGDFSHWPGVPNSPSDVEVRDALRVLWIPFKDFPLPSPVDRGGLLSAILTASCRGLLPTAPGYAISSPTVGSGKTLLALSLALLKGCIPEVLPNVRDEEEMRKRLLTMARAGRGVILLDNISGSFGSDSLCAFLTSEWIADRILGSHNTVSGRTNSLVLLTGNNPVIVGDINRRLIRITIDPEMERPYLRTFDLHPAEYIRAHRLEMARAALTILRAAHVSGFRHGRGRLASFEVWSDFVRNAVIWVGEKNWMDVADPVESIEVSYIDDPDTQRLDVLLTIWAEEFGDRGGTIAEAIQRAKSGGAFFELSEALGAVAGERGVINPRILGSWMKGHERRIVDGRCFARNGTWKNAVRWKVSSVSFKGVSNSVPEICQNDKLYIEGKITHQNSPNSPCEACVNYSIDTRGCDSAHGVEDGACPAFERVIH